MSSIEVKGERKRPNKIESFLLSYLKPLGFRYTGDFSTYIAQQNPDFIHRKKNIIVELFGRYWHTDSKEERLRINKYKQAGYKAIVIWDDALKQDLPAQINRVRQLLAS